MPVENGKLKCSECNQFSDSVLYKTIGEENGVYTLCDVCNKKQEVTQLLEGDFDGDLIVPAKPISLFSKAGGFTDPNIINTSSAGGIVTHNFSKDTNLNIEGLKFDSGKPTTALLPSGPLLEVAKVLDFGAAKYQPHNWTKGIKYSRVLSAAQRHLLAWNENESIDPESKLSHLAHAACNILFLLDYELRNLSEFDDRRKK